MFDCPAQTLESAVGAGGHLVYFSSSCRALLYPCDMSRGREEPSKEHHHRHPTPHLQAKENYSRLGPSSFSPRTVPQLSFPGYYNSSVRRVVPPQPPASSHTRRAAPTTGNYSVPPELAVHNNSHAYSYSPGAASFLCQQVQFLRGQRPEAPQFRSGLRGGGAIHGRPPSSSYQPQSAYSGCPDPNSGQRVREALNQDLSYTVPPQGPSGPRHVTPKPLQSQYRNQHSGKEWDFPLRSLCDRFQALALHPDRFDRPPSAVAVHARHGKVNITLTPDIQDQVHRSLTALKPAESISAKLLARKLRLPKKIVNKALYSLERSQKASKQGLLPPEWTLYKEHQDPPHHSPGCPQYPEAKVELKTERVENREQVEDESDTESTSSHCPSLESSVSEESQSSARPPPSTTSTPDQDHQPPTMSDQREQVLQYLLHSGEVTALAIAKNLGLKSSNHVTRTLCILERKGEICKNSSTNPPTWDLSTHRRERMERSLKATKSSQDAAGSLGHMIASETQLPGVELLPLDQGPTQGSHSELVRICITLTCLM